MTQLGLTLESAHVVFVFALHFIGHLQMLHPVASHIEGVEMTHCPLASLSGLVMGSGTVPMTIAGIHIELLQLLKGCQGIGQCLCHVIAEIFIKLLA